MRKVFERLDVALEELKLLQIEFNVLKTIREHGCQCSDDDACAFVRERNHYFEALQGITRDGSGTGLGSGLRRANEDLRQIASEAICRVNGKGISR